MLLDKYLNLLRLVNDRFCQYIKGIPGESVIPTPLRLRESPRIWNRIFETRTKPTSDVNLLALLKNLGPSHSGGHSSIFMEDGVRNTLI